MATFQLAKATPAAASESKEPQHMPVPAGNNGPLIGRWTKMAIETLDGKLLAWRQKWLERHQIELAEMRWSRPDYSNRVEAAAIAPDEDAA